MSVFAYIALSKDGRRTTGTLAADSRAAAISQMNRQGLSPVSIDEEKDAAAAAKKVRKSSGAPQGRVSGRAVEAFTRELANLLAGGVPLSRALSLLRREAANPAAKQLWNEIHEDVVGGTALARCAGEVAEKFFQCVCRYGGAQAKRAGFSMWCLDKFLNFELVNKT